MSGQTKQNQGVPFPKTLGEYSGKTVVMGDITRWQAEERPTPALDGFQFLDITDLKLSLMDNAKPDIVLSPLIGDNFDAFDVVTKLIDLNYNGTYLAIAHDLPDVDLIKEEIRSLAPHLDFDVFSMPLMVSPPSQTNSKSRRKRAAFS